MTTLPELDPLRDLPQPGTTVGRRFRLGRSIGIGGMSAVYLAHDARLERDVAFKILTPTLARSRELVLRFVNEARMLAALDCPHIVRVLDAGITDEPELAPLPYMVLELLRGDDLRTHCERGSIEPDRVVGWMMQACEGLAAAHAEGVIHRDLKPENLFLCLLPDGTEVLKLIDFGIARSLAAPSSLTLRGTGVGSPGYMSPEQLRDATAVDPRSDIWSLGVVMYELLAGVPPFASSSSFDLCAKILAGKHARLSERCPWLPQGLSAIVERCLALDPADRFSSVHELTLALSYYCPAGGVEAALRVARRLRTRDGIETLVPSEHPVDVQAPTEPALRVAVRSARPRRRQLAAHAFAVVSLAATLALLTRAFAPSLSQMAMPLSAAEASVTRVSERVSAAARDLLRPEASLTDERDAPHASNSQEGARP